MMRSNRATLRAAATTALSLGITWWALVEGREGAALFGAVLISATTVATVAMQRTPGRRIDPVGLLRFLAFFLLGSLRGGLDVALRALSPRASLAPALVRRAFRTGDDAAQRLFVLALNLMPGTLGVEVADGVLTFHVLVASDGTLDARLDELERRCAAVMRAATEEANDVI